MNQLDALKTISTVVADARQLEQRLLAA